MSPNFSHRFPLKVLVIGVGLIGGSFAKGLRERHAVEEVIGFGYHKEKLQKAVELGVLDRYEMHLPTAVAEADLIMLSVPLGAMQTLLHEMQPHLRKETIITDAGSAKKSVVEAVESALGQLPPTFVAGHPIAGKESSGVEEADGELFVKHRVILTPTEETHPHALVQVRELWQALGACVSEMTPAYHDEVLAATSHLPHLLAFALVDLLNEHEELGNVFQYTAGGFRDFTRIASSDATMWRDIAVNNSEAIAKWLKNYQQSLTDLIALVESREGAKLYELFEAAKSARDQHIVNRNPDEMQDCDFQ
jgi:prephenate dehydrogenase